MTFGPEHETFHPLLSVYREEELAFKSNLTVDSSVQVLLMVELNAGAVLVDPLSASVVQSGQHVHFPDVLLKPFAPRMRIVRYYIGQLASHVAGCKFVFEVAFMMPSRLVPLKTRH
ncbi:hypothetical protein BLA27_24670 [Brucella cytisi]|uniref:Uncharacterized protein n=1 Tax=Brucella cytisi TaxID=407152 RepID=A0A1J6HCD5_9HYPH|nr:hypothetical protein BLA27_24670 [Brucella cytisi]